MNRSDTGALLCLESDVLQPAVPARGASRDLFVSVNPDLVSDFGHYLNYEKRLAEACGRLGFDYVGLASQKLSMPHPGILPAFEHASGHYAMVRTSAVGQEERIAAEFRDVLLAVLADLPSRECWRRLHVFMYCGSSRLAVKLAELPWPDDLSLCINAFWDFLIEEPIAVDLPRLKFQRVVNLLAMSDLHAQSWRDASGLRFDWIPNPPPLLGDSEAYAAVRGLFGNGRDRHRLQVLVPGLMSLGKGRDTTGKLLDYLRQHGTGGVDFVFRDRNSELGSEASERIRIVTGDLSDAQVLDLYRSSDIVLLPYEAPTFAVRTSGALVDALMFGAVPLVLEGTWLAHQCRQFDVGRVLPDAHVSTVIDAVASVGRDLERARQQVVRAGALYLAHNTWSALVRRVTLRSEPCAQPDLSKSRTPTDASLFAAANRALRVGQYAAAAQLYAWLDGDESLSIYQFNLQLCVERSGRTLDELLAGDS